jgi:2-polyprenyl-3-methyl-5-hydroxy-6-metoxy-1,4-benzoquinol methylase
MNADMKKVAATWDEESDGYLFEKEDWPDYQAHFQTTLKSMGQVKNKKILNVGSGTGLADAYLAQNGAKVTLLDISEKSIKFSKKYFKHKGLKADFVIGDAFKMPFASEEFDIVWNSGVIEHFSDHEKIIMVSEMWKRVKRGGKLIIHAPNVFDLPFQIATLILKMRRKWAFGREDHMTTGGLIKIFNKAGVKVSNIFTYNSIVGWWFFPFGREITTKLGLNTTKIHMLKSPFGHIIEISAVK